MDHLYPQTNLFTLIDDYTDLIFDLIKSLFICLSLNDFKISSNHLNFWIESIIIYSPKLLYHPKNSI